MAIAIRRAIARSAAAIAQSRTHFPVIAGAPSRLIPSSAAAVVALRPLLSSFVQSQSFRSSSPLSDRRFDARNDQNKIDPDDILFEGCDYNHWLITMDFPKDPAPTREEMIETYIQTLAKVVGSVEEAKKRMYALSTTTYHGFQAVMTEEMSEKFRGLPGVVFILPDSYIDPVNKEYGGDKYENGIITPRPPPVQYNNRRPPRQRFDNRNERPNYNRPPPPPPGHGNMPPDQQGMMQGDGRNYVPQQNYSPNMQDSRNFRPDNQRGPMHSNQRNFQENQGNFAPRNQDFGREYQGNFAPQNQRTMEHAAGGDNFRGSGFANDRQGPAPGYGMDNRQQQTPTYGNDYRQQGNPTYGGENRQVGGFEHANAYDRGPDSAYGQHNYSGHAQGQPGSWQRRQ